MLTSAAKSRLTGAYQSRTLPRLPFIPQKDQLKGFDTVRRFLKSNGNMRTIVVAGLVAMVCGGSAAVAGTLVTSQDIQNGTIKQADLNKKLRKKINLKSGTVAAAIPGQNGTNGATGETGATGTPGSNGTPGETGATGADAEFEAGHWGVITRNTIGSPAVDLRAGPYGSFGVTGPASEPPFGEGSLGIAVANKAQNSGEPQEKASFGNEVDFFGDPVLGLTDLGFHVFQTGENTGASPSNLPNITFEIDANLNGLPADNYTSMVFVPDAAAFQGGGSWTGFINATTSGKWYLTGAEGNAAPGTGCGLSTSCTFTQLTTALNDGGTTPTIHTVAVGKGRDHAWAGAVDGLRINDTIYDFEPLGVEEIPTS